MAADLMSEIDALRTQIEALSKQIPQGASAKVEGVEGAPTDGVGGAAPLASVFESETFGKVKDQVEEFVGQLEQHLNEIPAGTAIAIFALGVLLGRLLPR